MKLTTRFLAPLLFASLLPSTAGADDDRSRGYDDRDYQRSDSDYGRYGNSRDGRYDERGLRDLAHNLEGWTRSAYREAARQYRDRYRGDRYRESDALVALDRLAEQARRFRREVDKSRRHGDLERRDFVTLERAYFHASSSLRGLRADRRVRDAFDRVHHTMDRIAYYYGGSRRGDWRDGDRYGDRDPYDRYDRDRYARDGYDRDRYDDRDDDRD